MAGMGPPPKPGARRPNNGRVKGAPAMVRLPSEGRKGPAPAWPLGRAKAAEQRVWDELWSTPQAVAWERLGWLRVVARYCRLVVEAEKPGAQITLLGECRQMEDRLGLSPMAMLRLRWEIVTDEVAEQRIDNGAADPRQRLRAVDPRAVAGS